MPPSHLSMGSRRHTSESSSAAIVLGAACRVSGDDVSRQQAVLPEVPSVGYGVLSSVWVIRSCIHCIAGPAVTRPRT